MKSEHVEFIKELLQQEIDKDVKMFNEAGEVDWNFGRWYLASQLLTTIEMLEQKDPAEKPMEKFNPVAAAGTLKNYCETIVGEEELHCYDCKFNDAKFDTCGLNGSLPCEWELPEEESL